MLIPFQKGTALAHAQAGRPVTLDPVSGAYFNDIRLTATREARRTQQKYDSMRMKWVSLLFVKDNMVRLTSD